MNPLVELNTFPVNDQQLSVLTKRQRQVASLACTGLSNRQIATSLEMSEGTVKIHLHAIYEQLGIHSRTQLTVLLAMVARQNPIECRSPK